MDGKMKENAKKAIGEIISMTELKSPAELRAAAEHNDASVVKALESVVPTYRPNRKEQAV